MKKPGRFEIDNAGHLFAFVSTAQRRPGFRFIAVLKEEVDPPILSRALEITIRRFPFYHVDLKNDFFWHYLAASHPSVALGRDDLDGFQFLTPRGPLLHLGYDGRKINLEMAHVLSDGFGAVTFLKTLLVQYFRLTGIDVPFTHGALDTAAAPRPEEYEDGYKQYSRKALAPPWRETRTFRPEGSVRKSKAVSVTTGVMKAEEVLKKARARQASVTHYLGAALVQSLDELQRKSRPGRLMPVKVSISADLRKFYPARTLRNFSGFCNAGIFPAAGQYTFDEILHEIRHQSQWMLTEKNLNALISRNVGYERNVLLRALPLFLKKRLATLVLDCAGSRTASMDLTNMGSVDLPEAITDKVERFDTIGGNLHCYPIECGVISYRDILSVSFSRAIDRPFVENRFFEILEADGVSVQPERYGHSGS